MSQHALAASMTAALQSGRRFNEANVKRGQGGKFATKAGPPGNKTSPLVRGAHIGTQTGTQGNTAPRPGAPRIEEDTVPGKSPGGGTLKNYDGRGSGHAVYTDGSVYDGKGWQPGAQGKGGKKK